jgi:hypothetical protein
MKGIRPPHDVTDQNRGAKRYEIALNLRYAVRRQGESAITGSGRSVNMSSSGLLFRADRKLQPWDSIVLALDWPVTAIEDEPLYLIVSGYVVRVKAVSTAMSISRSELVRARDVKKSFELFSNPAARKNSRPPILRPTAVIDEDEQAFAVVSAILAPQGWVIERAEPKNAKALLNAGFPPVGLLVTRTVDLLDGLDADIPAILTVRGGLPDVPRHLSGMPLLAIVEKPLIYGVLRDIILRFCEFTTATHKETSA